jgi:hypothetical protein
VLYGESTMAAEVASTTAEVRMATEMTTTMPAEMPTTMAAAVTTAAMPAASRNGIAGGRQHGHQNDSGNPNIEFRHGTLTRVMNSRHRGTNEERRPDVMVPLWQQKRRLRLPGPRDYRRPMLDLMAALTIRQARDKGLYQR